METAYPQNISQSPWQLNGDMFVARFTIRSLGTRHGTIFLSSAVRVALLELRSCRAAGYT